MSIEQAAVELLIAIFSRPGMALTLAGLIFLAAVLVMGRIWMREAHPVSRALFERLTVVNGLVNAPGDASANFAHRFDEVEKAMMRTQPSAPTLNRAWIDYRQTFIQLDDDAISTSTHAGDYFHGAGAAGRSMDWWANIFVAIGLLFTFLGIVAALSQATMAIAAGASADQMQAALAQLLSIAAAKFWTSIAGIGASLMLRIVGRRWRDGLEEEEDQLSEALDACVRHVSPQGVALLQLQELQRLVGALAPGAAAPARELLAEPA
ncbi:MAG: hypothetical protein INR64_07540 [Caulobacteraceae bacterium]|nr:hypothetical protein [Caulobacter sp.]